MREHRFKANGLTLNCLDYGGERKHSLLFIHGGSAHAHWWDFVAPAFIDDFHVLALDLRGHGDSEWSKDWAYSSQDYASDLDQVIEQWKFRAPILVGHSMGAHNVLVYAVAHSEKLRGVIALDSPADYTERGVAHLRTFADKPPRRFKSWEEAIRNFKLLPRETLAKREILEHAARFTYGQLDDGAWTHKLDRRTLIREPSQMLDSLPNIQCPALIVKIKKSPVLQREAAIKMAEAIPHGQFAELDDSFHHAMLDNPAGLITVLRGFLKDLK